MTAGFARAVITPPVGSPLAGYAARQGVSQGVNDELYARAMVVESGGETVAMASVDVLALPAGFLGGIKSGIRSRTGILPENLLIAATHTHSGPVTLRTFFNDEETIDAGYLDSLAGAIEKCILDAWRSRFPARLAMGTAIVEGVGFNRSDPNRPIDRQAAILRVDDPSGGIRGVAVQYGCHPTVLGFENLLMTGDYPAMALKAIEESLGGCAAMFFNGAEGNVSVNHASELNAIGVPTPDRTFARASEIGNRLAEAVLAALPRMEAVADVTVDGTLWPLELDGRSYDGDPAEELEQARTRAADCASRDETLFHRAKADELYARVRRANRRMLKQWGGRVPFTLQAIRMGETTFLGVPGELFTETGLELKRRVDPRMFVIGLANGYYGYVPTEQAFAEGGYESAVACCAPDSEQRVLASAMQAALHLRQEETREPADDRR